MYCESFQVFEIRSVAVSISRYSVSAIFTGSEFSEQFGNFVTEIRFIGATIFPGIVNSPLFHVHISGLI